MGPAGGDEPTPRQQPQWLRAASIAAYSFSFFVFGLEVNLLGPTTIDLAAQLDVPEADLGSIYTLNGLISILGAAPSGWLTDSLPGHTLLAASLALQALGLLFVGAQRSLVGLALTFGAVALSWNIVNTAGNVLTLQQAPEGRAAFFANAVNALFGIGALAAPLLAQLAATHAGGALAAYPITAALTAASAALFLALPSPPTPKALAAARVAEFEAANGAAVLEAAAVGGSGDEASAGGGSSSVRKRSSGGGSGNMWAFGGPFSHVLLPSTVFIFLSVGLEVGFGGWTTVYATQQLQQSEAQGRALTSAYWAAFTAGRVAASLAAAAVSPGRLLLVSLPLAAVGAGAALAVPSAVLAGWPAVVCVSLVGVGLSTGFANMLALLSQFAPVTGSLTGLLGGCAGAGTMLTPLAVAALAKYTPLKFQSLMWVTLGSVVLQLACLVPVFAAAAAERRQRCGAGDGWADDDSLTAALLGVDEETGAAAAAAGGTAVAGSRAVAASSSRRAAAALEPAGGVVDVEEEGEAESDDDGLMLPLPPKAP